MLDGLFGNLFDFNGDDTLDTFEETVGLSAFAMTIAEEDRATELELSGLDLEELEFMDIEERRQVLEETGLDPDDYDF